MMGKNFLRGESRKVQRRRGWRGGQFFTPHPAMMVKNPKFFRTFRFFGDRLPSGEEFTGGKEIGLSKSLP